MNQFLEKYLGPFLITAWVFLAPMVYWFTAIGLFMAADLCLRMMILKKNNQPVLSEKMWRTAYKFGAGCTFIIVAYACQHLFAPDIPMMKIVGSFLILVELKSIDEKAKETTGYSIFKIILDKLTPKK